MIRDLSITALVENTTANFDLLGEWGLSLWIEADDHRILYDTGQGRTLLENARLLGIDLSTAEAMVLSHGHSDHSGGIATLMASGFRGKVFASPAALGKKYQKEKNQPARLKGMPEDCAAALRRPGTLLDSAAPRQVVPGVMVTGGIPRLTALEDPGGAFFLDEACTQPDLLVDDQALLIETAGGWVVITGCGHSGAVNTMNYAAELTGARRLRAFVGGMHLMNASEERLRATTEAFRERGVGLLAPCHCTGFTATGFFQRELGAAVMALRAGTRLRISEAAAEHASA